MKHGGGVGGSSGSSEEEKDGEDRGRLGVGGSVPCGGGGLLLDGLYIGGDWWL